MDLKYRIRWKHKDGGRYATKAGLNTIFMQSNGQVWRFPDRAVMPEDITADVVVVSRISAKISMRVLELSDTKCLRLGFDIPCECLYEGTIDCIDCYVQEIAEGVRSKLCEFVSEALHDDEQDKD